MPRGSRPADDRADSEAAFDLVYGQHCRAVHAYLVGRTGDPEAALDLLQETFLRVWRHLAVVRDLPVERQRSWIFTVARNALTDGYRQQAARTRAYERYTRTAEQFAPPVDEPDRVAEGKEALALLDCAIRRLPEDLRTVLLLDTLGEMSSTQIGEVLGRPAGTVRYQVSLARRQLAREVGLTDEG